MPLAPDGRTGFLGPPPEVWRHGGALHRRACSVFGHCATVSPPALPALASAFAEYLLAWREAAPERGLPSVPAAPQRLRERAARLDFILRRAEQAIEPVPAPAPVMVQDPMTVRTPVSVPAPASVHAPVVADAATDSGVAEPALRRPAEPGASGELGRFHDEAARLLTETRSLLRSLDSARPAAQRARLALVAAWGRYDDGLSALRQPAARVTAAQLTEMAELRDALLAQVESARSLCAHAG